MQYGTHDQILGGIDLTDSRNEGCSKEGVKIRIEVDEEYVKLFVGPRDWQWDKETGEFIGCGTCLAARKEPKSDVPDVQFEKLGDSKVNVSSGGRGKKLWKKT